jgi:hypothetical protein
MGWQSFERPPANGVNKSGLTLLDGNRSGGSDKNAPVSNYRRFIFVAMMKAASDDGDE